MNTSVGGGLDSVTDLNQKNQQILDELAKLQGSIANDSQISAAITEQIANLQKQNQEIGQVLASLDKSNSAIADMVTTSQNTRKNLEQIMGSSRNDLKNYRSTLTRSTIPQISQSLDGLATVSGGMSATLSGITPMVDQLSTMLQQLQTSLDDSVNALTKTGSALEKVDAQLETVQTDIKAMQSSEAYQEILELEGIDAEAISEFMASPVSINSEVLYDVENYGTGMTPFYTNLALWVGGLILVSILKQEVDKDEEVSDFSNTSAYFGRWLLFVVLAVIQGFIVCIGDIVLLKVQCVHPALFVASGMFCSFIYVNIIFAMALTFKHIGKAFGRMFSGEALFQNRYTATGGNGMIAFASSFPGQIVARQIAPGQELIVQKSGFLASEEGVDLSIFFQKKFGAGFFGGEGFIMQRLSGNGIAFLEFDGHVVEYELRPGQQIVVDTGYLAAMDATCSMEIQTVPGLKNIVFGGEGVFNTVVTGPGHVWLQTMPISSVAGELLRYMPAGK